MARGGARSGAGRPAYKLKGELLQRVDVREWARRNLLNHQGSFGWTWTRDGEPTGNIGVLVLPRTAVTLQYTLTFNGEVRHINDRVNLIYRACHLGGSRPWFNCPRCARQVAILYMRAGRFACRNCQIISYSSQAEDAIERAWRKQRKIEAQLGENWERPVGMRKTKYARLCAQLEAIESERDQAFAGVVQKLLALL